MLHDLVTDTLDTRHLGPEGSHALKVFEASWRKMGRWSRTNFDQGFWGEGFGAVGTQAFVLNRIVPGAAHMRLIGSDTANTLHLNPCGRSFGNLFTEKSRETVLELMDAAFTLPAIVSLPLVGNKGPLRRSTKAEVLLLPINNEGGRTKQILGAIVVDRRQRISNLQFDLSSETPFRCEPLETLAADRRASNGPVLVVNNS